MRRLIFAGAALMMMVASIPLSAAARIKFYPYEGLDTVMAGSGGTKLAKNGIEYWTTGTPPHRYRVVGMITDERDENWDGGHTVGSPKIAKLVAENGGSAVIVMDSSTQHVGDIGFGSGSSTSFGSRGSSMSNFFGSFFRMGIDKKTTRLLVVRYINVAEGREPSERMLQ